jgi:hypothetical protein
MYLERECQKSSCIDVYINAIPKRDAESSDLIRKGISRLYGVTCNDLHGGGIIFCGEFGAPRRATDRIPRLQLWILGCEVTSI